MSEEQDIQYVLELAETLNSDQLREVALRLQKNLSFYRKEREKMLSNHRRPTWTGTLMYKHRAFSEYRFKDLGIASAYTREEALAKFSKMGLAVLAEEFENEQEKERHVESYEIRVRPASKAMI